MSIRYRLHGESHPFSEVIGVISAVTGSDPSSEVLLVVTRKGDSVRAPVADIVAAKLFPL